MKIPWRAMGILFLFAAASLLSILQPAVQAGLLKYSVQAGAWGSDSSRGNLGVRAEIRTNIYHADNNSFDYFWVGDNLANGAFIQFGYGYEPGYYCLSGHETQNKNSCVGGSDHIGNEDPRWQWQFWPNISFNEFYYGIGPADSAGVNQTWHAYSVIPESVNRWTFVLDGQQVDTISFRPVQSRDPAYIVAEKGTNSSSLGKLGPVEFRHLQYMASDGWHSIDTLTAIDGHGGCGALSDCSIENPYGVIAVGPNDIVAGSNTKLANYGDLLWTSGYMTLAVNANSNAVLYVSGLSNSSTYRGTFSVRVPKGMFVYVSLVAPRVPSAGFLGELGATDQFQGWTGAVDTANSSIRLLMDQGKSISAEWTTDYSGIVNRVVPVVFLSAIVVGLGYLVLRYKAKKKSSSALREITVTSYSCPVCGEHLFYVSESGRYFCNKCRSYL